MAPHSSTLAWKIPWMEEPDRLQSMGLLRVRHHWETSLSLFTFMHWRGKWQPTPVFLPGESQGQGSLVGCHLWGRTESDTTEAMQQQQQQQQQQCVYINNKLLSYLSPFPFGNLKFVFYVCGFICFVNKFICIFYLESTYKWYDVCLSLSDLLHLVW